MDNFISTRDLPKVGAAISVHGCVHHEIVWMKGSVVLFLLQRSISWCSLVLADWHENTWCMVSICCDHHGQETDVAQYLFCCRFVSPTPRLNVFILIGLRRFGSDGSFASFLVNCVESLLCSVGYLIMFLSGMNWIWLLERLGKPLLIAWCFLKLLYWQIMHQLI